MSILIGQAVRSAADLNSQTGENIKIIESGIKIVKLAIQTSPGARFRINGSASFQTEIGITGIYEIDLQDIGTSLVNGVYYIKNSLANNEQIIVDYLYEEGAAST